MLERQQAVTAPPRSAATPAIWLSHTAAGPTVPRAIRDGAGGPGAFRFLDGYTERCVGFAELSRAIDQRAAQLLACGLRKGDRMALIVPDNYEFLLNFLGALQVGIVPVPMFPPLGFGKLDAYIDGASRILNAAGACLLITTRQVQPVLGSLLGRTPSLRDLLCTDDFPVNTGAAAVDIDHIQLDDIAFLQFTSGSTAWPKGVIVTHRSLLANLNAIMRYGLQLTPQTDSAVSWLPTYHDMGLIGFLLAPLWYMGSVTFISTLAFLKNPAIWLQTVSERRGTVTFAPNFAFALAMRRTPADQIKALDLSCLKVLGCGAEPNHPGMLREFLAHFAGAGLKPEALMPCYGMAEATLAMTFCGPGIGLRTDTIRASSYHGQGRAIAAAPGEDSLEIASCGRALPDHKVSIIDESGQVLPDRHIGEIQFAGPSVTPGYYGQEPGRTYTAQGLRTGDLGYVVDGELFVTGRRKDLIILNGRNYDPQIIEWEVTEVPGVRKGSAVAFSRPSRSTEELVIVAESRQPEAAALRDAIQLRVRESLQLSPADVVLLAPGQVPKPSSGKLQRARARSQYLRGALGREGVRTLGHRGQWLILAKHLVISFLARLRHRLRRHD